MLETQRGKTPVGRPKTGLETRVLCLDGHRNMRFAYRDHDET